MELIRNFANMIILVLYAFLLRSCTSKKELLPNPTSKAFTFPNGSRFNDLWLNRPPTFEACSDGEVADSYLVFSYVNTSPANEIVVDVKYELEDCAFLNKNCKYTIGLYALRVDSKFAERSPTKNSYTYIGTLQNQTSLIVSKRTEYTSQFVIGMAGRKGIFIAFRDTGICGAIKTIDIHYITCPTKAGLLMTFEESPAPNTSISVTQVMGKCVTNSIEIASHLDNYMSCYANGTGIAHGGCKCNAGYEIAGSSQCRGCPPKTFKPSAGSMPCSQCAKNVKDGLVPRTTVCQCLDNFFRPKSQLGNHLVDCEEPPSAPTRLNASEVKSQWAIITWLPPSKQGTGDDVKYSIRCEQCETQVFQTDELLFNLTDLKTYSKYNISVYSENNVTNAVGKRYPTTLHFRTLSGLPSSVQNLKAIRNDDGSVIVSWDVPAAKGGPDLRYYVIINGERSSFQKYTNLTIHKKLKKEKYHVLVRSHTNAGFSAGETIQFEIQGTEKGIAIKIVIGVGVTFGVLMIIAIFLIIYFYKRRHPKHLQTVRLEDGQVILPKFGGNRLYVDPKEYEDLADAVQEFAKELKKEWIVFGNIIGGGEFGNVYSGFVQRPTDPEIQVAIKTLKSDANSKAKDDFLAEAAYMGQFDDPNVVALEGVIVGDGPIMIVTEFMSNGSLNSYLAENRNGFTTLQLLGMARGVSSGMTYLSEMNFIHRDLAARNILVDENMICKVADFGMSRELSENEYSTTGGKIPVRWTAPEAIQYKRFTTASDIWSYGILLWEIMSYAERPYWDWGNYEVYERLASGYRLPPPMGCPKVVHDLMLSCWNKDKVKRPKFRTIRDTIDKWIRNPDLLRQEDSVVTRRDENLDYASMNTLKEWLISINMGQYLDNFSKKGLVTPRQILELTDSELRDIGVIAIGHRNKIIKSIKVTKTQLEGAEMRNDNDANAPLL